MKCIFCDTQTIDTEGVGLLDCHGCPIKVRYICSGSMKKPEIWYIQMRTEKAVVELAVLDKLTSVYTGPIYDEKTHIITLDYLVEVIPSTATEFANRILNMKVFL